MGKLTWASATDGRLRPRDRMRLLAQGVISQAADLSGRLGLRGPALARFDLDQLRIPDTAAAREAEEICGELRPEMLVNHSYRTYAWASVLAAHEAINYDAEVLYVSSLVHDSGLSEHHSGPQPTCFTLRGASDAEAIGTRQSWPGTRSDRAAEAITMHMNLRVRPSDGPESYLMAAGTQLDVVGARLWQIAPETAAAVLRRYPRRGVKQGMTELFRRQAREHRGSRSHFYWRYLGLPIFYRLAPFEE